MKIKRSELSTACQGERELFAQLFGDEVEVTRELCLKHASDFCWSWAARKLLPPAAEHHYNTEVFPAVRELSTTCEAARKECMCVYRVPSHLVPPDIDNATWVASQVEAQQKAQDLYEAICQESRRVFNVANALAFFHACELSDAFPAKTKPVESTHAQ